MKKLTASLFTLLALGSAALNAAGGSQDAQQSIAAAKAAQQKADALQGGWTTTDKLIEQAEEAANKGDSVKAIALANKAEEEANLARAQAEHESEHWSPPPYLMPKQ